MASSEDILRGVPVNKTAAVVTSQTGCSGVIHISQVSSGGRVTRTGPGELVAFPGPAELDLTGKVCGDVTVVGYCGKRSKYQKPRWSCRCNRCGYYTTFSRELLNRGVTDYLGKSAPLCCTECAKLEAIRNGWKKDTSVKAD